MEDVVHVMKYICPRQFGLHNVFSSTVDLKESAHPFMDYTLREQEMSEAERKSQGEQRGSKNRGLNTCYVPKRLRSGLLPLVAKLLKLHSRCSYVALLEHYCPIEVRSQSAICF